MFHPIIDCFIRRFVRRDSAETDLQEELQSHLSIDTHTRIQQGQSPESARDAARREFGNLGRAAEETRDAWGFAWLDELSQDVKYGLRMLRRSPGFTSAAIMILALGIGANAAIFTLVNAVLLSSLPVKDPSTLWRFGDRSDCCVTGGFPDDGNFSLVSKQNYLDLKANLPEFEDVAAIQAGFGFRPVVARPDVANGRARSVMGEFVSANYFHTLGIEATQGRLFRDADDLPGAPVVAVLSYAAWQSEYAADPAIVGSTFWINTKAVTIAGIAPRGFYGDRLSSNPPQFYLPLNSMGALTEAPYVDAPLVRWLYLIGRARPGVDISQLRAKVNLVLRHSLENIDSSQTRAATIILRAHATLTPGGAGIREMQENYASNLRVLLWTSALVLIIACANISNLLLVRGAARKAELSLRTAIGAKRRRLVAQCLTESALLSLLGGLAGIVVAYAGVKLLINMAFPGAHHLPIHATPSPAILAFAIVLSLLTGILSGIAPAWLSSHAEPIDALRSSGRATFIGSSWVQRALVVIQIALSLMLLVGAGLFGQSLNRLRNTDLKVETKNRYIVHINPPGAGYTPSQVELLYRLMEIRFHDVLGITKVGICSYTPMEDNNNGWMIELADRPQLRAIASFVKANAEYFDSVGTHVLAGRGIQPQDTSASQPIAVVNENFVRRMFKPGENPIGHFIGQPGPESSHSFQIVGVVENSAYTDVRFKDHSMFFVPLAQRPANTKQPIEKDDSLFAGAIVLATSSPNNDMEAIARRVLSNINPNLAVVKFQTFDEQISDRFTDDRLIARLTSFFAAIALLLATVGLYGVTAYGVVRRTPEIGLRMALGAKRSSLVAMILKSALAQTLLGLAIGIPAALACVRFVKAQLYQVSGANFELLALAVSVLFVASILAASLPAHRAASTDPMRALRTE